MDESQRIKSQEREPYADMPGMRACKSIERAVKGYESYALLAEAFAMLLTAKMPHKFDASLRRDPMFSHWESFREYLLGAHSNKKIQTFQELLVDLQRFMPSQALIEFDRQSQNQGENRPYFGSPERIGTTADRIDVYLLLQVVLWAQKSRKVTSLKESTVRSFTDPNESYPMPWADIVFPYDSFVIEVPPKCLRHKTIKQEVQLASLIVSLADIGGKQYMLMRPMWEEASPADRIDNIDEVIINAARRTKKKNWTPASLEDFLKTAQYVDSQPVTTQPHIDMQGITLRIDMSKPVDDPADDEMVRSVKRIIAGTALYMSCAKEGDEEPQGTRSKKVRESTREPNKNRRPTIEQVIADPASVLTIDRVTHFSPTRNTFHYADHAGVEHVAHVVRTHMRRKPNTPKDAPKEIKVPSYWKGLHTLPEGMAPGVSVSRIDTKK